MQYTANDLFQLQTQLTEAKVDIVVSKTIDRVLDRINSLQVDINNRIDDLKADMDTRFAALDVRITSIDNRLTAVETKLGMTHETQGLIRAKFIEYAFKTGWIILGSMGAATAALIATHLYVVN